MCWVGGSQPAQRRGGGETPSAALTSLPLGQASHQRGEQHTPPRNKMPSGWQPPKSTGSLNHYAQPPPDPMG